MASMIYVKSDDSLIPINSETTVTELTPGMYRIKLEENKQPKLTPLELPTLPDKVYGNVKRDINIVMKGYTSRKEHGKSTGVMLTGSFGVGKTMFCNIMAHTAIEAGLNVYVLDEAIKANSLGPLLQNLPHGLVWVDEFDKVCPRADHQNEFLTILDGVYSTPSLFLFTSNSNLPMAEGLTNRPSRIFYRFDYITLDDDVIDLYVKEKLNPELFDRFGIGIKKALSAMPVITMDMLSCLVEEINRVELAAHIVMNYMNINPKYIKRSWDGTDPVYLPRIYKLPEGDLCEIEDSCATREIMLDSNIRLNLVWLDPASGEPKSFNGDVTSTDFLEMQDKMMIYKLDSTYVVGLYPKPANKLGVEFKEPTLTLQSGESKTFFRHDLKAEPIPIRDRFANQRQQRPMAFSLG